MFKSRSNIRVFLVLKKKADFIHVLRNHKNNIARNL